MLKITNGAGFQMTFANGWTVSVQFHAGAYCDNKEKGNLWPYIYSPDGNAECANAEIAAWDKYDVWYTFEHDSVKGWCSADEVADFIAMVKGF